MERKEIRKKYHQRAVDLVKKLTLKEMMSQLLYDSPSIPRLGIPAYNWWNEGLHGAARSGTATVFPQAIGLASSFDRDLLYRVGDTISTEQRAKYNAFSRLGDRGIYKGLTVWSPNINLFRDPRWGRGQETYGEDPYLTSELAVSFIHGLQGDGDVLKTAATAKHFYAHSGPEKERHHFNAIVSKKDAEESYLPQFRAVVERGDVDGIMSAYSAVNGEALSASSEIEEYLRKGLGFNGIVISDCWAIRDIHEGHHITSSPEESAALALKRGCDLNCGCTYRYLEKALSKGLVNREDIEKACIRVFETRFSLGLFDDKTEYDNISLSEIESSKHRNLSLKASLESIVLLENRDSFLPLKGEQKFAIIGPNANSRSALWGNYHGTSSRYVTILDAFREYVGDSNVYYSEGCALQSSHVERLGEDNDRLSEAIAFASLSDVVVLCLGLDEKIEGEMHDDGNGGIAGDKDNLYLPTSQRILLKELNNLGKPIIVVLLSGGSLDPEIESMENVKALLQGWYPGEYGGEAIAKIILGKSNPSGKLPVTFYRGDEVLPPFESYSMENRTYRFFNGKPLYPFSYGLSYTTYKYSNAELNKEKNRVSVDIENTGNYSGDEISFVFVSSNRDYPISSLCGFTRTTVLKGKKRRVTISLSSDAFTYVTEEGKREALTSPITLHIGSYLNSANSISLTI